MSERIFRLVSQATLSSSEFDYIIVGGGSAGAVLASRLSQDPSVSVLLLEAGQGHSNLFIDCPGAYIKNQLSEWDWKLKTVPQKHLNNRVSFWPRGKGLGGSSLINAMIYIRGDPRNYDRWAKERCAGWDYKSVLPYFKKSEDFQASVGDPKDFKKRIYDRKNSAISSVHGIGGPMAVSDPCKGNPHIWSKRFVEAGIEAGLKYNPDLNGSSQDGIGIGHCTVRSGVRESTSHAFLKRNDVMLRKNLTVWVYSTVEKVVFQGDTASGVLFRKNGRLNFVGAKREVVLCAGAIHSATILMNSGVGPAQHLRDLKIPIVKDLPVGLNLQDHLMIPMIYEALDCNTFDDIAKDNSFGQISALLQFLINGSGLMTSCGLESSAFYNSKIDRDLQENDSQIMFLPVGINDLAREAFNIPKFLQDTCPRYGIIFLPCLVLPKSKGSICLNPKDPLGHPIIDPNYLSNSFDLDVLVHGMKLVRKIAQAKCLKGLIGKEAIDKSIPHDPQSDEYLREYARRAAITIYHPVGTVKMGARSDPTAVVDPELKVKGLNALRVADASVMPVICSGNTNAPTIMIAEKASDLILSRVKQ